MTILTAVAALSLHALLDGPTGSVAVKCTPDGDGLSCALSWLILVTETKPLPTVPSDPAALEALCKTVEGKLGTDEALAEVCRKPPAAREAWLLGRQTTCHVSTRDQTVHFVADGETEGARRWRSKDWSGFSLLTKWKGKLVDVRRLDVADGNEVWLPAASQVRAFPQQCARVVLFNKDH